MREVCLVKIKSDNPVQSKMSFRLKSDFLLRLKNCYIFLGDSYTVSVRVQMIQMTTNEIHS